MYARAVTTNDWQRAVARGLALAVLLWTTAPGAAPPDPVAAEAGIPESSPKSRPVSDTEVELGRTFLVVAEHFALTRYARATRTETGLLFEYLPEGETLEAWRTLGSLLLVPVAGDWEAGEALLPKYVDAFRRRQPAVKDIAAVPGAGGMIWFMDYEVGSDTLKQHNLAAIWQVLPGTLGVFQTRRRDERFEAWQIEHFQRPVAQLDRAEPPAGSPSPTPDS
jgi:hypothetical protein